MPIFKYRCTEGHEGEALRHRDVEAIVCPCGAAAWRLSVNRIAQIGRAEVPRDERNYRQSYSEYREALGEVAHHYERVNNARAPSERLREPEYYDLARQQAIAQGAPIL